MPGPVGAVVEVMARALVDRADDVRVTESERRGTTFVLLGVGPGEQGKVIGRQGRIIDAMRVIAAAAGAHHGIKATLELIEPDGR
jgi:uncharacterized protein